MSTKESVIYELYDTLLKLRYPEVARTSLNEFENSILTGTKRIDLLCWVLQKSSNTNVDPLSKLKDNSIKDKLVKCYTQIGLYWDENILLGKCDINKQLDFLSLLTLLIKNVHSAYPASPKNVKNDNHFLKLANETTSCANLSGNINCKNNDKIIFNRIESSELIEDTLKPTNSCFIDEFCSNIKKKTNDLNIEDFKNWNPVLEEFNSSFKKIVSLPVQDNNSNVFSSYNNLRDDSQKVSTSFSIVNKTLINKSQIQNRPLIDKTTRSNKYLSEVLRNNLVLIEQACNLFDK